MASRRRLLLAPTSLLVLAVLSATCGLAWSASSTKAEGAPRGSGCAALAPARVATRVPLPAVPMDLAKSKSTLWVALAGQHNPRTGATLRGGEVAAVDIRTGRLARRLRLPIDPTELEFGFGSLWALGNPTKRGPHGVLRINPRTGRIIAVIRMPRGWSRIATTTRAIWVGGGDITPGTPRRPGVPERTSVRLVYKIDPRRNVIVQRVLLPGGMTVLDLDGEGASLWIGGWWGVAKLSNAGRVLFHAAYAGAGWSMARTPGLVWVTLPWSGTPYQRRQDTAHRARQLLRISTASRTSHPTAIELPRQPGGVEAAGGTIWLGGGDVLARLNDEASPPTVVPSDVVVHPTAMEPFADGVWVAEMTKRRLTKVVC
jgi:hypothetical protein